MRIEHDVAGVYTVMTVSKGMEVLNSIVNSIRLPDIAVGPFFSPETELSPRSKRYVFHEGRMPELVIEVTSTSTYHVDLHFKWVKYARCGIEEYFITDRSRNRVIRGYFDKDGKHVPNGDPYYKPSPDRASKRTTSSSASLPCYCRQVLQGEDIIKVKFLELLSDSNMMKVSRVLRPKHVEEVMRVEKKMKAEELKHLDYEIKQLDDEIKQHNDEIKRLREENKQRDDEINRLNQRLRRKGKADSEEPPPGK